MTDRHKRANSAATSTDNTLIEAASSASTTSYQGRETPVLVGGTGPETDRRVKGRAAAWNQRVSNEELIAAYRETGSVWRAAKHLGLVGQSVHERLRRLGYPMAHQEWTEEELKEARSLATQGEPLGQIAARLGRTYAGVALKLSRSGVRSQHTGWREKKPKRGAGLTKKRVTAFARKLEGGKTTVRRLARMEGVAITPLVDALQFYEPQKWQRYVLDHSDLGIEKCPGCGRDFVPLTKKQQFCTVHCRESHRRNMSYFGGRRQEAVGLREGVCQLCRKKVEKWLSAHHVLGKQNDPNNEALIALCRGCHDILTRLAARPWVEDPEIVADLISLVLARRGRTNAFISVDIEEWTAEEIQEYIDSLSLVPDEESADISH